MICSRRQLLQWAAASLGGASLQAQTPELAPSGPLPGEGIRRRDYPRSGYTPGYYQPVKLVAPAWIKLAWVAQGTFVEPRPAPLTLGLLMGQVYRFRAQGIPGDEETAVYPTVEVIDRLYAPAGQAAKFPIPIEIAIQDLRLAARGQFLTRVVYVEHPDAALPINTERDRPTWFDAGAKADPIRAAQEYGRPLAILRLGGRQPLEGESPDWQFLGPCPPLLVYQSPAAPIPADAPPAPGTTTPTSRRTTR